MSKKFKASNEKCIDLSLSFLYFKKNYGIILRKMKA